MIRNPQNPILISQVPTVITKKFQLAQKFSRTPKP